MANLSFYVLLIQLVLIYGVSTMSVTIEGSTGGLLGENGTEIKCLFPQVDISYVTFWAFNKSITTFEIIATYRPDQAPQLNTQGQYLHGRVTLTHITKNSTKAIMIFNNLMCIDDTSYRCQMGYFDNNGNKILDSNNMNISVEVPPSKPDSFSLVQSDSPVPTTKQMDYSTSSHSTTVTPTENEIVTASFNTELNATTVFNHSSIQKTYHNTSSPTPSNDDLSPEFSYRTTTFSTQQTTIEKVLAEGGFITVVCSGYVGKPPSEHVFQKYRDGHKIPLNYTVNKTSIVEDSENCSYYRTSDLTFQVTAEDNHVIIQCAVNSPMAGSDMLYVESEPIKVYYNVRTPTVTKHPNKRIYIVSVDRTITLTCTSDGNPKPSYRWYKDSLDDNISIAENFTIRNINTTDRGLYTCNVSNTINGLTYTKVASIEVNIMNEADKTTTESTSTDSSSGANDINENSSGNVGPVIGGVLGAAVSMIVIIVITYCVYKRRKTISETILQNESESLDGYEPKAITESMTGNYDYIALEEDTNKTQTVDNEQEIEDIREHNQEYLKKQEEEEHKNNDSNSLPKPADKQEHGEEGTYAETHEGIYDKAGDRRHINNENDELFDTSNISSKQNSNRDNEFNIGCYNNQAFEKEENLNKATVSPTIRSSDGFQNDENTESNFNSQSKEGYEHIIAEDQTGTSEENSSHRTAL